MEGCDTTPHISPPRTLSVTRSHGDIVPWRDWPHGCSSSHHCSSASAQTFHKILRGDHPSAALTTQSRDRRPPGPPPRRNNCGGAALCGSRYSVGHISRLGNRNQLRNLIHKCPWVLIDIYRLFMKLRIQLFVPVWCELIIRIIIVVHCNFFPFFDVSKGNQWSDPRK